MRVMKKTAHRDLLSTAAGPVLRELRRSGRLMECLEERRLLAAPQIAELDFAGPSIVDKTLFIPVTSTDADGDDVNLSATVTGPDGAGAAVSFTPGTNRWLEMDVEGYGTLLFQLFDNVAPETVSRIAGLADSGYYDDLRIGRVEQDFVIQFGSPNAQAGEMTRNDDTSGGPDFTFDDEFDPDVLFTGFGQLAMANSGKDTNGSQLFITQTDTRFLDGNHTVLGQLVRGFDANGAINDAPVVPPTLPDGDDADTNPDPNPAYPGFGSPTDPIVINSVRTVSNDTDGVLRFTADTAGEYTVTITATDENGETSERVVAITAANDTENSPSVLLPFDKAYTVDPNQSLQFDVPGADPEGDALDYRVTLTGDADGTVTVNEEDQTVTYTPGSGFTGRATILVELREDGATSRGSTSDPYDKQLVLVGVGDASVSGQVQSLQALAGVPLEDVTVATFTDLDATGDAGDWTAEIDWGDGDVTTGTVVDGAAAGTFNVIGSHTYENGNGSIPLRVTLTGSEGAHADLVGTTFLVTVVSVDGGTLTINGTSGSDTINVVLNGDNFDITVNGVLFSESAVGIGLIELFAGDGDDTVVMDPASPPTRASLGAGNDTYTGGLDTDEVYGGAGDDIIDGSGGNDYLDGGAGNDYIMGGTGIDYDDATRTAGYFDRDTIFGGPGNDTLSGGLDANEIYGGDGDDLINGSGSRDTLDGGAGADRIRGYGNDDSLLGGAGNDTLLGDHPDDDARGGPDNAGNDTLEGGDGDDVLFGYWGDDLFRGGAGADSLFGGDGTDTDDEGDENDVLDSIENVPS